MLVRFTVKNFKSFKDKNEFSMVKGKQRFFEERVSEVSNLKLLKFSSIFGANASGKSNLVRAMKIMQWIVLRGNVPLDAIDEYYKLDDNCKNKPTYFEMVFTVGDDIFSYGYEIHLSNREIESEWLLKLKKTKAGTIEEKAIFERTKKEITFGHFPQGGNNSRLLMYSQDIVHLPGRLFLSHVAANGFAFVGSNSVIASAILMTFNWFQSSLKVLYSSEALFTPELSSRIDDKEIGKMLERFDTGIKSIELILSNETEFRKDIGFNGINFDLNDIHNSLLIQKQVNPSVNPSAIVRTISNFWVLEDENNKLIVKRIEFYHDQEEKHPFKLQNESDGTLRLFELAEALLNKDKNKVIIVDELDRCLHPMLTIKFVQVFLENAKLKHNNSQLIVTSHESRLLDLNILRRDEIWFIKKEDNKSHIYSLEEFNVRFDKIVDKAYLEGRYGGVPVFDSIFFPENVEYANKNKDIR